jgi:hypothetical protein
MISNFASIYLILDIYMSIGHIFIKMVGKKHPINI